MKNSKSIQSRALKIAPLSPLILGAFVLMLLAAPGAIAETSDIQMLPPLMPLGTNPCPQGAGGVNQMLVYSADATPGHSGINCVPATTDARGNFVVPTNATVTISGATATASTVNAANDLAAALPCTGTLSATGSQISCSPLTSGAEPPTCTGPNQALQYSAATGFTCTTISGGGSGLPTCSTNGDVLTYNAATASYTCQAPIGGGLPTCSTNGDVLTYNAATASYTCQAPIGGGVSFPPCSAGDVLTYNGSTLSCVSAGGGGGTTISCAPGEVAVGTGSNIACYPNFTYNASILSAPSFVGSNSGSVSAGVISGSTVMVGSGGVFPTVFSSSSASFANGQATISNSNGAGWFAGGLRSGGPLTVAGFSGNAFEADINGAILFTSFSNGQASLNSGGDLGVQGCWGCTTVPSDMRLKKNIVPITGALQTIEKLQGVRYDFRSKSERTVGLNRDLPTDKPQIGFIAQEVAKVLPEAVTLPSKTEDIYTLDTVKIIPLLVESVKEMQKEIETLQTSNAKLQATNANLQQQIKQLDPVKKAALAQ